jgi:hypothetical protein
MTTPSISSDLSLVRAVAKRVLELHGKATAGPWQADRVDGNGSELEAKADAELIALYRNVSPGMAACLLALIEDKSHISSYACVAIHQLASQWRAEGVRE